MSSLHMASVYALLDEFPGAKQIAVAHLTRLTHLLAESSKGRYGRDKAIEIREAARQSIGSVTTAKSLELRHTIRLIRELDAEIAEIEQVIQRIMDKMLSPITTIPGIGYRMGAMILSEVGDFSRFDSPDKILAYAGLSPSTYQSGQLKKLLCPYGEARLQIPTLCHLQCHKICLPLGPCLCRLPRQETRRGKALQCGHLSCCQEAGPAHLCSGEIRRALSSGSLILSR
nr:transposase IS116/IS110/IS902 family protein [Sporomusa sphaeroides DSM 2875]